MPADLQRKLTTILAADAKGYSSAMARDESRTVRELRAARAVFSRFIDRHGGRIANTAGDGLIAEFPSVVEAVQCAIEVQTELRGRDPEALRFRIGIHLGDVIVDGADLLGDGVNIAARLESMADPGGVLISRQVFDQVHSKLSVGFQHLGERQAKHLPEDVDVYSLSLAGNPAPAGDMPSEPVALREPARRAADTRAAPDAAAAPPPPPDTTPPQPAIEEEQPNPAAAPRGLLVAAAGLLAIDLLSGGGFWAHWPILGLLTAYIVRSAPRLERPGLNRHIIRAGTVALALICINLFSWSGFFWAIWPVGAILAATFLGGGFKGRDT